MADLVPNEGSTYVDTVKEKQDTELQSERAEVLKAIPFLQGVIDWFDKQADETDRASNIDRESKVSVEAQLQAYELLAGLLKKKKGELQAYYDTYKPKQ